MGKYKYLIYDFDGTIGDTYNGVVAGMKEVFAAIVGILGE